MIDRMYPCAHMNNLRFSSFLLSLRRPLLGLAVFVLVGCASVPVPTESSPAPSTPTPTQAAQPHLGEKRIPHIGLALGGGAARGFAHVGVIQALEEAGIRPELVAGTSAGSLVAALYASGKNSAQLKKIADSIVVTLSIITVLGTNSSFICTKHVD